LRWEGSGAWNWSTSKGLWRYSGAHHSSSSFLPLLLSLPEPFPAYQLSALRLTRERERETDRQKERERDRQKESERDIHREREREKETDKERERQRERQTE